MRTFRICAATRGATRTEAFSGMGGLAASARWHTRARIVYTAQSLSLAALETLVHLKSSVGIKEFVFFEVEVPDKLILRPTKYPEAWKSDRQVSRALGDAWLRAGDSPALVVPTVLSPGEWTVLINPVHAGFSLDWVVRGPEGYGFDGRLV